MTLLEIEDRENVNTTEGSSSEIQGIGIVDFELKGNTEQQTAILPTEYTQVDYIESNGTQYIDTGFKPNQNTKVETELLFNENYNNRNILLYGTRGNGDINSLMLWDMYTTKYLQYTFGSNIKLSSTMLVSNSFNKIVHDVTGLILNGNTIVTNSDPNPSTWDALYNLLIFTGRSTAGKVDTRMASAKIKYFKIYNGNTLVRDFIPCYRNSDNEIGLYDIANNVFYANQGTGTFTYGSVVSIPNPDYPQDIKVVTENNTITIGDGTNSEDYTINLGSIELCKIGDYQDYIYKENDKWYKKGYIGKVVLDGSEEWNSETAYTGYYRYILLTLEVLNTNNGLNNRFTQRISQAHGGYEYLYIQANNGAIHIQLLQSRLSNSSIADFKTWLSNNNVTVYYVLATPTTTEITNSDLISELEDIAEATLYNGTNYITMTSESNLVGTYKIYYSDWYRFEKIVRSGYNIVEDNDRITQKFANGNRKQFVSDYTDCTITLNLDTLDLDTTREYIEKLTSRRYKYYSIKDNQYKEASFIIQNRPNLVVNNSINNNADINEYQVVLLKAGD